MFNIFFFSFIALKVCKLFSVLGNADIALPSIDPLEIDELRVVQDLNAVAIDAKVVDTALGGLSKGKILKITGFDKGQVEMKFTTPQASFIGPYKLNGKILRLPIQGSGNMKVHVGKIKEFLVKSL